MKYLLMGISLMLLFFVNTELSADKLYTWTDGEGNLHITEHPPPQHASTKNVMTYQPRTEAQIQKIEADERREEMQDEVAQKKESMQVPKKASAQTQQQDEEEEYIGREGKLIRRAEEGKEMRERRPEIRPEIRFHRR